MITFMGDRILTPYERAKNLYAEKMPNRSFEEDFEECANKGFVFVAPDYFLAGFRVGDGWFVRIAIGEGKIEKFLELMPYPLPYVGWAREPKGQDEVEWYLTEKVKEICARL